MRKTAFAWTATVFVLGALAIASSDAGADDVRSGDDGWRRTAQGWERSDGLSALGSAPAQSRFVFGEERRQAKPRWDVHPGLLVAAEVLLISGAFLAWPRPRRASPAGSNGEEDALGHPSRSDLAA
jgi:hypothetical protein